MYQRIKIVSLNFSENSVKDLKDNAFIPFAPGNTDYQRFKREINADEAQLQNADESLMSAADAKAFVATLP